MASIASDQPKTLSDKPVGHRLREHSVGASKPDKFISGAEFYPAPGLADGLAAEQSKRDIRFGKATDVIAPATITKYVSGQLAVVSGGSGTLAHKLDRAPDYIRPTLVCLTAEHGFVAGDVVAISPVTFGEDIVIKYDSGELTITAAASHTLNHGLGGVPDVVRTTVICTANEHGWVVGDELEVLNILLTGAIGGNNNTGVTVNLTATQIVTQIGSLSTPIAIHNTSGVVVGINVAKWKYRIQALRFDANAFNRGITLQLNNTNIITRLGSSAKAIAILDSSGNVVGITNANWALVIHAFLIG